MPSPPGLTLRQVLTRACTIAGVEKPTVRRIPKLALRAAGLIEPIAAKLPEVAYQFDNPFVMDWDDCRTTFEAEATPWDVALRATLNWWQHKI